MKTERGVRRGLVKGLILALLGLGVVGAVTPSAEAQGYYRRGYGYGGYRRGGYGPGYYGPRFYGGGYGPRFYGGGYGYGPGFYNRGYYGAPVIVPPPVVPLGGFGYAPIY